MAEPSVVEIPFSFTADCLSRCCLPPVCRCGSNYTAGGDPRLCDPLPPPPAEFGRVMPPVLYGHVTGYKTRRWCLPGPFSSSYGAAGGCWEYLSVLTNWRFTYGPTVLGGIGYQSDVAVFARDGAFLGYYDALHSETWPVDTWPVGAYVNHMVLPCGGEQTCWWTNPGTVLYSAGPFSNGPDTCQWFTYLTPGLRYSAEVLVSVEGPPDPYANTPWVRSGVISCEPFFGRVQLFEGGFSGTGETCDQSGHPDPPCCPSTAPGPMFGLKGPCGLLSNPPQVWSLAVGADGYCVPGFPTMTAPLAVNVDFTESPL